MTLVNGSTHANEPPAVVKVARLIHRRPAAGGRQIPETTPNAALDEADSHQQHRSGLWNSTDMETPASSFLGLHQWHNQLPAFEEMPSSSRGDPSPASAGGTAAI